MSGSAEGTSDARKQLVVIGGGMSAQHFLESIVVRGGIDAYSITLISEEFSSPYDRVHLGRAIENSGCSLGFRDEEWYLDRDVQLRLKDRAVRIDREKRVVETASGAHLPFDAVVIATGGSAFLPPVEGNRLENVSTYRTLEDAERIAREARRAEHVVVAGGGLLGLEVARSVQQLGPHVTVVEMAPRLLPRQLDVDGAAVLETMIRNLGLELRLMTQVSRIGPADSRLSVELSDGSDIETDFVIFAAGIRPRDDLARESGLDCHPSGGIEVGDGLQTSDSAIYAIGECARHRGELYGLVAPCYEMAEIVAERLLGGSRTFTGASTSAQLKIKEVTVSAVGESLADGTMVRDLTWAAPHQYRRVVIRDGRIVGAIAVGEGAEFPRLLEAVASRARIRASQERRFATTGLLWKQGTRKPMNDWPDAAIVCTCMGVQCGALRSAWAEGCQSSRALREATGAGSVCGSCQPLIAEIAGEVSGATRRAIGPALPVIALGALVLAAMTWFLEPIPMARSVLVQPQIDFLWRDAWWKQASGYFLVALILLTLTLPLRKRIRWTQRISFSRWRVIHTAVGLGTILAAGIHTGLRLGAHLNFVLMTSFLGLVAVGSVAGLVTSLESRLSPRLGSALRAGWNRAHVLLFWPMPVLILFHVAAVYLY